MWEGILLHFFFRMCVCGVMYVYIQGGNLLADFLEDFLRVKTKAQQEAGRGGRVASDISDKLFPFLHD